MHNYGRRIMRKLFNKVPNPAYAYDQVLIKQRRNYQEAERAVGELRNHRRQLERDVFERRAEIARVHDRARQAVRAQNEERALELLERKQHLHEGLREAEAELARHTEEIDDAMSEIRQFSRQIAELERERDRNVARIAGARARRDLRAATQVSTRDGRRLDRARQWVAQVDAEAQLERELSGRTLEDEIGSLMDDPTMIQAKIELARLKSSKRRPFLVKAVG